MRLVYFMCSEWLTYSSEFRLDRVENDPSLQKCFSIGTDSLELSLYHLKFMNNQLLYMSQRTLLHFKDFFCSIFLHHYIVHTAEMLVYTWNSVCNESGIFLPKRLVYKLGNNLQRRLRLSSLDVNSFIQE